MNKMCKCLWLSVLLLLIVSFVSNAQEAVNLKTRIKLNYTKNERKEIVLISKLTIKQKRYTPFIGVLVHFYNVNDTLKTELSKVETNELGEAQLTVSKDIEVVKNEEGFMTFEVEFEGNDSSRSCSAETSAKEAEMELAFYQKDSLKYIEVSVVEKLEQQEDIVPMEGVNVSFFVKGTFSLLKIEDKQTEEDGKAKIEFPIDIPGDTAGVVTIVAQIEDDDNYGTVKALGNINWAIPIQPITEKKRGLGDTDAPLWMVYTLIILLSAVWFHYLYVVIQVVKIKLDAKKQKRSELIES